MHQKQRLLSLFILVFLLPVCVQAQEYVPPPMFGGPGKVSKPETDRPKAPEARPVIAPRTDRVSKQVDLDIVPPKKPTPPKEVEAILEESETVSSEIIIDENTPPLPTKKPQAPAKKLSTPKKPKPQGVVTGPKTMPAVPAKDYVAESTFEDAPDTGQTPTILERHEESQKEESVEIPVSEGTELQVFTLPGGGAKKIVIPYAQGNENTSNDVLAAIQAQSVAIFNELGNRSRLQIMAYATPFDAGISSDRRMSLSRALNIRDALLVVGIEAQRMDVRALGQQTDDPQKDRVDLIFYTDKAPE